MARAAGVIVTMEVAVVTARDMEGAKVVTVEEEGEKEVAPVVLTGATVEAGVAVEEEAMLARFSWAIWPGVPPTSIFTLLSRLLPFIGGGDCSTVQRIFIYING